MQTYYLFLEIFYYIFCAIICVFIGWNIFKTKKITSKVIGALALLMFLMRLFKIR